MAAESSAGPKIVRLLYFVGAGFVCAAAINKWRELEQKSNNNNNNNDNIQLQQKGKTPSNAAVVE